MAGERGPADADDAAPVPDLSWVEPWLAVGSRPYAGQRESIRRAGVESIVSLHQTQPDERAAWSEVGLRLVEVPIRDWVAIPSRQINQAVEAVLREHAAGRRVLLHCLAGVNRAPTVAAAVLCRLEGLGVEDAVRRVRAARPAASPTPEQLLSLGEWARRVTRETS